MTTKLHTILVKSTWLQACVIASSLGLSACGGSDDESAPADTTATATPMPTQAPTAAAATPTPAPTAVTTPAPTSEPTAMPTTAPTAVPTPMPTATVMATPTPTPAVTASPTPSPETFVFPFRKGEKWTVCQGYNTPSLTHKGSETFSLDLSADASSASGSTGCNFTSRNASTGFKIVSPVGAMVLWDGLTRGIGSDVICLRLNETASNKANSVLLGHVTLDVTVGDSVTLGQEIGTVSEASSFNGGYAHIHIGMYESDTCQGESIVLNDVFNGSHNFTSDGSEQQWRGTEVSR